MLPKPPCKRSWNTEKNATLNVNGWTFTRETGDYGTDYLQRAYIAATDLGANRPQDLLNLLTEFDGTGKALEGIHHYTLHFPKGCTPPVNGFWSLTMYNQEQYFVPNPLNRYMLNSFSKFKYNKDGSLDLYLQKDSPGKIREANWLPAPDGKFVLMLRLYWPTQAALDNTWTPPAIMLKNRP